MRFFKSDGWKKFLSGFMALVMLVGLIPLTAQAAEAPDGMPTDITLNNCELVGEFISENGLGSPQLHFFDFDVNGTITTGFCLDHGKHMGYGVEGCTWTFERKIPAGSELFCVFADYYTNCMAVTNQLDAQYPELSAEEKFEMDGDYIPEGNRPWVNGWVQSAVWLFRDQPDVFNNLTDDYILMQIAKERTAAIEGWYKAHGGTSTATDESSFNLIKSIVQRWYSGGFTRYDYYKYAPTGDHKGYDDQSVLIPYVDGHEETQPWLKVRKVTYDGSPLANAVFTVYYDASCTDVIGTMTTGADGWGYCQPEWDYGVDTMTVYVKETSVPPGGDYTLDPTVYPVTVSASGNSTKETAAAVNSGIGIPNGTPEPSDALVRKIDKYTKMGVANAIIRFVGQSNSGLHIDTTFPTGENGDLPIQWKDPDGEFYIPPGQYTVTEQTPPPGYQGTDESYHLVLRYEPEHNVYEASGNIVFENPKLKSLIIKKVDPEGNGLEGAIFEIFRDSVSLGQFETEADGTITYAGPNGNGIESGLYEIIERKAPDGYLLPYDVLHSIYVNAEALNDPSPYEIVAVNYQYPEIIIKKVANGTDEPVAGAYFNVKINGRDFGQVGPTGADGTIVLNYDDYKDFLDPEEKSWTVEVQEAVAPDGYLLDDDGWKSATFSRGQATVPFVFSDTKYPSIKILKRDKETQEPLQGATFNVWVDGHDIGDFTTNATGYVEITYEDYGRFLNEENWGHWGIIVQEIGVPDNYNKDKQEDSGDYTKTGVLEFGAKTIEFEFEDTSYRDIKVTKKDADTDWPLAGAEFTLESVSLDDPNEGGSVKRSLTTDATGFVIFEDVPNGTYKLWESVPPKGYESNDEVKTIVVTSDDEPVIEFEYKNEPHSGIRILKLDAATDQPIPGALFRITPMAPLTGPSFERETDENGLIVIENAEPGTYKVEELSVPDPYVVNSEPHLVEVTNQHDAFPVTIYNHAEGMLYIQKLDAVTHEPLAGAYFDVHTAGGTFIATVGPTGPNGFATLAGLEPGSYVVKEIKAPDGHVIDPVPQSFEVSATDSGKIYTLIFDNKPTANLWLRKYDQLTKVGLEGAVFKLTTVDGTIVRENLHSGPDGFIKVNDLEEGAYLIQETEAPEGYILNPEPKLINLRYDYTEIIDFPNVKPGSIAIRKVDAKTGAPLAGATFELYSIDDQLLDTQISGEDGYAYFRDLEAGQYIIKETVAPEGYTRSTVPVKVEVEAFKSTEYEWKNGQNATLTIIKRDKETKTPLANATFEVRSLDGTLAATLISDASGYATTDRLTPGWYKVVETIAPNGYLLDSEEHLIELKENTPAVLELFNQPAKGIVIHKVDGVTQDPLAGAVIELQTIGGKLIDSYTTDSSGTINTQAVEPGYYYLVETKAPDGYVLDSEPVLVEVEEGIASVVTIKNYPETVIQIYKTDSVTGDPLGGAEFTIKDINGNIVDTVETDLTGWAYTKTLPAGRYTAVESIAPDGYSLDTTEHEIVLQSGKSFTLRVTNTPDTSLHITKIDSASRETLEGAVFEVKKDCGTEPCVIVGEYTTDHNGLAITEPLEPGIYYVTEVRAPMGYVLDETEYEVCVKAGQFNNITIENIPAATLIARKIDSRTGQPIAGAVFKLETADHSLIGTLESDANGEAIFTNLKAGHYIITEVQAPPGYQISSPDSQTITIEYGKNNYCDFVDAQNGGLVIILQDKHTGEYLPGGQFIVTREDDQIVVFDGSTDETGTIVVGDLLPGWYTVEQVFAPDDYTMIDTSTKVEILVGRQQTVYFYDETAGIVIEKVDSTDPDKMLEGARFQIKRDEDGVVIGEYVTNKDGAAMAYGLTPGLYTVTELVAPEGYSIDEEPKTVHVKGGSAAHVTFADTPLSGITVAVVDQNTREPIVGATVEVWVQNGALVNTYTTDTTGTIQTDKLDAGYYVLKLVNIPDGYAAVESEATVEIKDGVSITHTFECISNGVLRVMSTTNADMSIAGMRFTVTTIDGSYIGEFTTGTDGTATIPSLTPGWYIVKEEKAPDGYTISSESEQRVEVISGQDATVIFRHSQIFGLQIRTTCQQTNAAVEGAVYRITELNGAVIGTYTSDKSGVAFATLTPGWYQVTPISVPDGYTIPDSSPRTIEVKADGITVTDFVVTQMSSIRVKVVDGSTGRGIYGVRLLLKNGTQVVSEYTTNNEGYITLTNEIRNGDYTLEMISAPSGYTIDSVPKSISALVGQTTEITWALYQGGGQIQAVVTSADYNKTRDLPAGSLLQGAVFEIVNADTYQLVGTMISDARGVAASSGLPIGRYMVKMVTPPSYYACSDQEVEVRLKINNDVVQTQFQCVSVNLGTEIQQKSNTTIRAGSNMRVDILKANNTSDVRLDNFNVHYKVPTDCARISTLSTGTWNQAVWYSISYKTNMADYRVLASNLLSTSRYQYDLSTQSLGLQSGEYVTDIRFEFNTVPAGFAVVDKSALSLYVLSTVANGYKLISRAEISGQYNTTTVSTTHIDNEWPYSSSGGYNISSGGNSGYYGGTGSAAVSGNSGQWTSNTSLWTVTVTNPVKLPSTLPKTGY